MSSEELQTLINRLAEELKTLRLLEQLEGGEEK